MRGVRTITAMSGVGLLLTGSLACRSPRQPLQPAAKPRTFLAFHIRQNQDMILFSHFGHPAQWAIWLEHPDTGELKTVFVTRRSGTGQWKGKAECPAALPRWFEVYRRETGRQGLPTPNAPAPDAVTQATPQAEEIIWTVEVAPSSRWICWLEVNLSADFNEAYPQHDETTGAIDTDYAGQPSLLYRGEITAEVGARVEPQLYGCTVPGTTKGEVQRDLKGITTAREIFTSIEIRVVASPSTGPPSSTRAATTHASR